MYEPYVYQLAIVSVFILTWNLFAVLGLLMTLRWIYRQLSSKRAHVPVTKTIRTAKSAPTKKTLNINLPQEFDRNLLFLTLGGGLIAVAISSFIFINWESYTDLTRMGLIMVLTAIFYTLSYFFRKRKEYHIVSDTFLLLASVAVALTGVGLWNYISSDYSTSNQNLYYTFWGYYTLILTAIYTVTYKFMRSQAYLYGLITAAYLSMIYFILSSSVSQSLLIPLIAFAQVPLYLILNRIIRRIEGDVDQLIRLAVLINTVLGVLLIRNAYSYTLFIDLPIERITGALSIFVPFIFTLTLHPRYKGRELTHHLWLESVLLPVRLIAAYTIYSLAPEHFTVITIMFALLSWLSITLRINTLEAVLRKRHLAISYIVTALILLIAAWMKPPSRISLNLLITGTTYLAVAGLSHLTLTNLEKALDVSKASRKKLAWQIQSTSIAHYILIPVTVVGIGAFLAGIDQLFDIDVFTPEILGTLLLIPTAIHLAIWFNNRDRLHSLIVTHIYLILSILFTLGTPLNALYIVLVAIMHQVILLLARKDIRHTYSIQVLLILKNFLIGSILSWNFYLVLSTILIDNLILGSIWRLEYLLPKLKNAKRSTYADFVSITSTLQSNSKQILLGAIGILLGSYLFGRPPFYPMLYILIAISPIAFSHDKGRYRYVAGMGIVLLFWYFLGVREILFFKAGVITTHLTGIIVSIYLLVIWYFEKLRKVENADEYLRTAFIIPLTISLIHSLSSSTVNSTLHALILFIVASLVIYFRANKEDLQSVKIAQVYIILQILVLLKNYVVYFPWWLYLGLIGSVFITITVIAIHRVTKHTSTPTPTKKLRSRTRKVSKRKKSASK